MSPELFVFSDRLYINRGRKAYRAWQSTRNKIQDQIYNSVICIHDVSQSSVCVIYRIAAIVVRIVDLFSQN